MALLRWSSAFDCIETHIAETGPAYDLEIPVPGQHQPLRLGLEAARNALYALPGDELLQKSIWRTAVTRAQADVPAADWRLRTVWLAIPALRRTAHQVSRRLGSERTEVEAEILAAVLAELRAIDPDQSDLGRSLVKAARNRAWCAARRRPEVVVADAELTAALQRRPHRGVELHVPTLPHKGAPYAPPRVTVPRSRLEGDLLQAMADDFGLRHLVVAAARTQRGPRIGTLALRPRGGAR
ncbi:hypothetical protein ACFWP2_19755 [Kitasatospora sp. NPDC058444]|uniref:hypothetical protein n=1 Tax=Kitasatospora sp. NPDC058444 TaxID=3346504 RepID=UPI0036482975